MINLHNKEKHSIYLRLIIVIIVLVLIATSVYPPVRLPTRNLAAGHTNISAIQKGDWKQFDSKDYRDFGFTFSYPRDWIVSRGNGGPAFTSPDRKLVFSLAGPYNNSADSLISMLASSPQTVILKQIHANFRGHPAVLLETSESEDLKNPSSQ